MKINRTQSFESFSYTFNSGMLYYDIHIQLQFKIYLKDILNLLKSFTDTTGSISNKTNDS